MKHLTSKKELDNFLPIMISLPNITNDKNTSYHNQADKILIVIKKLIDSGEPPSKITLIFKNMNDSLLVDILKKKIPDELYSNHHCYKTREGDNYSSIDFSKIKNQSICSSCKKKLYKKYRRSNEFTLVRVQ